MTEPSEPLITYQSGVAGALMPGERVLWEDHPHPPTAPPPQKQPLRSAGAIVLLTTATAALAGIGTRGDVFFITLAALVMIGLTVLAVFLSQRKRSEELTETANVIYRITDRRVIRSDTRPHKPCVEAVLAGVSAITTKHGPRPGITIDGVPFQDLQDLPQVDGVLLRLLGLWSQSGRRKRIRRMGPSESTPLPPPPPPQPSPESTGDNAATLPPEIRLAQDERVLWIGRPRVRGFDGRWFLSCLQTLAWLLIPSALLLSSLGYFPIAPRVHWAIGIGAAMWLVVGLWGMSFGAILANRRKAREVYVLTNIRAIHHRMGKRAVTRSQLLDMVSYLHLSQPRDGVADVYVGSAFTEIPQAEAERLHALALDAVRRAGIAPDGIITPPSEDDDLL